MNQIVPQAQTQVRRYNVSDIQPRVNPHHAVPYQDERVQALAGMLSSAIARELQKQQPIQPQYQEHTHVHTHVHQHEGGGVKQALIGLAGAIALFLAAVTFLMVINEVSTAQLPTVEEIG